MESNRMLACCGFNNPGSEIGSNCGLGVFSEIVIDKALDEASFTDSCFTKEHELDWFHLHFY